VTPSYTIAACTDAYDWTIYTSTNAVEQSLLQLRSSMQAHAAIGNAT
jgi:uroporphyrinogen-III synthase